MTYHEQEEIHLGEGVSLKKVGGARFKNRGLTTGFPSLKFYLFICLRRVSESFGSNDCVSVLSVR